MAIGIAMRIQVLPGGIIIGHVVPVDHPANGHLELKENSVYELFFETTFGTETFREVGEADVKLFDVQEGGCSIDKFITCAGGQHLTVNGV